MPSAETDTEQMSADEEQRHARKAFGVDADA